MPIRGGRFAGLRGASASHFARPKTGVCSLFKTRYGKVGTEGQQTLKTFGSPEAAAKEAAKLVAEKVKKGYVEE